MQTVAIVIHLMIVATLIGAVLLQKSEGGGLGVGGGGGFMSSRGTANLLPPTTDERLDSLQKSDLAPQPQQAPTEPQTPRTQKSGVAMHMAILRRTSAD